VHRQEIYEEIQRNNKEALTQQRQKVPKLPSRKNSQTDVEPMPAIAPA